MYICPLHFLKSASSQGLLQRVRESERGGQEETGEVRERGRREKKTEGKIEGVIKKVRCGEEDASEGYMQKW